MKKRVLAVLLTAAMCFSIAACGKGDSNRARDDEEVIESEGTTEESTEESSAVVLVDETELSEISEETIVETTETTEAARTIEVDGFQPFTMPAEDTTYIDMLIDAGIAPEYYRGTYIDFIVGDGTDDFYGDLVIYFVNSNTDPDVRVFDFTDAGDGLSDADAEEALAIYTESYYCYYDYYENYDGRQAIDLDGDGEISDAEMGICAFFTSGVEWRGLDIDQVE